MKRICLIWIFALGFLLCVGTTGCAKKKSRSISVEGPDSKYELELKSTDKKPDDEDEEDE